jgi:hypothetical protein
MSYVLTLTDNSLNRRGKFPTDCSAMMRPGFGQSGAQRPCTAHSRQRSGRRWPRSPAAHDQRSTRLGAAPSAGSSAAADRDRRRVGQQTVQDGRWGPGRRTPAICARGAKQCTCLHPLPSLLLLVTVDSAWQLNCTPLSQKPRKRAQDLRKDRGRW